MSIGLCITSIFPESETLRENCQKWLHGSIHIAMDIKSNLNGDIKFPGYIPVDRRPRNDYELACKKNSYTRKNIAFIEAAKNNKFIFETDDDNLIDVLSLQDPEKYFSQRKVNTYKENTNIFRIIYPNAQGKIWARGYNIKNLENDFSRTNSFECIKPGVVQFLVSGNPDVDAIYRLVMGANVDVHVDAASLPLSLKGGMHPFNSQATLWKSSDLHLMYLPACCDFRMTDIFRGYVAQRILKERGQRVLFENVLVHQDRNQHKITDDFFGEHSGYIQVGELIKILEEVNLSGLTEHEMMLHIYWMLVKQQIVSHEEMNFLEKYLDCCR